MATATIRADFSQFGALQRKIDRLVGMGDALPDAIGALLVSSAQRRIDNQGPAPDVSHDGAPWPPLSPAYAERKRELSSGGLLQLQGHLQQSIQHELQGVRGGRAGRTTTGAVVLFAPTVYAATHQHGDEKRGIPARPFLGVDHQDVQDIDSLVDGMTAEALQ